MIQHKLDGVNLSGGIFAPRVLVFEVKVSGLAKGERGNGVALFQVFLIILVLSHVVTSILVPAVTLLLMNG